MKIASIDEWRKEKQRREREREHATEYERVPEWEQNVQCI